MCGFYWDILGLAEIKLFVLYGVVGTIRVGRESGQRDLKVLPSPSIPININSL